MPNIIAAIATINPPFPPTKLVKYILKSKARIVIIIKSKKASYH